MWKLQLHKKMQKRMYSKQLKNSVSYIESLSFFPVPGHFIFVLVYPAMSQPLFYFLLFLETVTLFLPVNLYFHRF